MSDRCELEDWLYRVVKAGLDLSNFLRVLEKREHFLIKQKLILFHLQYPTCIGMNKVKFGAVKLSLAQYKPIKLWSDLALIEGPNAK